MRISKTVGVAAMCVVLAPVAYASAQVSLVSTTSSGAQAFGESAQLPEEQQVSVSADGRFVCFTSLASDLVASDGNSAQDVFVKDRQTGAIERVSVSTAGVEANGLSTLARISATGRYVVFESSAINLVAGDGNGQIDVFLRDRQLGTTELVSVATGGAAGDSYSRLGSVSSDGRFVTWVSNATTLAGINEQFIDNVYLRDRQLGTTTLVTLSMDGGGGNGISLRPVISADGSVIVFSSLASDLATGPVDPAIFNAYAYERITSATTLLTVGFGGVPANANSFVPQVTPDGTKVVLASLASNLTGGPDVTAGRDIFVINRTTGVVTMENVNSSGQQATGTGTGSFSISGDGRYVTFRSDATNLVLNDTNGVNDLFRRDRVTGQTTMVSIGWDGAPANAATAHTSAQSQDGTTVVFGSAASNLVATDANGFGDIFARVYAPPVLCDLNGDGIVDGADLGTLLGAWGACVGCPADVTGDGVVDGADLGTLLGQWTV